MNHLKVRALCEGAIMVALATVLSYLKLSCGCQTCLVGIQPATTEQGIGMSEPVKRGAELLAEILEQALMKPE